eukprot:m.33530 g.33530  ORF g.33530 m.33530 type:complete len:526 (-) comp10895_c0_seq1:452-2029(-)
MDRIQDFKNKGKTTVLRNRRRENAVELRKQKRFEQTQKRRNVNDMAAEENEENMSNDQLAQTTTTASPAKTLSLDDLPRICHIILNTPNFDEAFEATRQCRRILAKDQFTKRAIAHVIEAKVVPRLVEFLSVPHTGLQYEAAWALTNVASGSSNDTMAVVSAGAVSQLVGLLSSEDENVREQAIWCLGNIAGEGAELRDLIIGAGILEPLIYTINNNPSLSMLQTAVWVLSNLCRGKNPEPNFDIVQHTIPTFLQLLDHEDVSVQADATWALSYLTDGDDYKIQTVLDAGCAESLVALLGHSSVRVVLPAIRCVGNIVTGSHEQTQVPIDLGCLQHFANLIQHPKENIKKEICWAISNITAGTREQVATVIEANLIPSVIYCLINGEFKTRKEACFAITNLTNSGTKANIRFVITQGCIKPLVDLLTVQDIKVVEIALEALQNILKASVQPDGTNPSADWIEEVGGLDIIELLQQHENQHIYTLALSIIENYFGEEDDEMDAVAPQQTSNGFAFAAPVQAMPFSL